MVEWMVRKEAKTVTIKRRLFWSNILMIIVPVLSAALVAVFCIGFIWLSMVNGVGLNLTEQESFDHACMVITEAIEYTLEHNSNVSPIQALLESNGLTLRIRAGEELIFEYGAIQASDLELIKAADFLNGESTITMNGRRLYAHEEQIHNIEYAIYLLGGNSEAETTFDLKTAFVLTVLFVIFAVFLSILLTNRFLTKFVFKKIEKPLDILSDGVREIRDGNLNYRIQYTEKDEFKPVCSDINEMAERLKQFVELTQKQEDSRRELVAGISHDIRSPLTSIQAYVEGLLDGVAKTPAKQQLYLETIKAKAENLAHIVSQLFLFSQMELGEYPESPCMLRLDQAIMDVVTSNKEDYEKKGLAVSMELEPAEIYADPLQVRRVITNILENSLKYKEREKGKVWIRLELTEQDCQLTILDDGPGVSEEALPHLFDVFYRSDPSRQNSDKGSGLGLAIVANAVRRMGGTVKAFHGVAQGLGICINLPKGEVKHGKDTDC